MEGENICYIADCAIVITADIHYITDRDMRRDTSTRQKRDECREKKKEGEAVYGTERIWKFCVRTNQFSLTCIANTGKDSCRVETPLPLSAVNY